jgi:DNA (cytosine-5)-methyltransferase 1
MRYLSVCSGIEAATVAWHPLGWQPVAFSEIEKFPSAVLAHHYPTVPNLGDMTKFQEWPDESVELLVGGTPCQSFSVAGLRKGLEDPRGNLMLTFVEIAQRYRPRWVLWENVPGVLSLDGGRAFGTLLGALGVLGYGWAYRVLDAQWFGVAQRRRRVFVVGHLGDWQRAAQVLFERESVRRDTPPSREARQGAAAGVGGGPDGGRIAGAVTRKWSKGSGGPAGDECYNMVAHALRAEGFDASEDGTGRGTPLVPVVWSQEVADPLTANEGRTYTHEGSNNFRTRNVQAVAQPVETGFYPTAGQDFPCLTECSPSVKVGSGGSSGNPPGVQHAMQVRRLTPTECERLQGFQDGYTNIPWRKKPEAPDGPRYKALGNSMAVPCMAWIGKRIAEVGRGD